MSSAVFNWLPPMAIINILLFGSSLVLLLAAGRKGNAKRLNVWIMGISFWLIGMVFDALKDVEGWGILRIPEHLFQLGGSIIIAYAAYEANKRIGLGKVVFIDRDYPSGDA